MSATHPSEAAVLVGGKGTRLESVMSGRPKPLAEVAGRPFVEWQLLLLRQQGVRRVILCTGYGHGLIAERLGDGRQLGIDIVYSAETSPLGTGGALRLALDKLEAEHLLVLNGDSYCRFDVARLHAAHHQWGAQATMWLMAVDDCGRYGAIELDDTAQVRAFNEKTTQKRAGLINAGVYLIDRTCAARLPTDRPVSLETEFFPSLAGHGLYGLAGGGVFLDIGTPESYRAADTILADELRRLANTMV